MNYFPMLLSNVLHVTFGIKKLERIGRLEMGDLGVKMGDGRLRPRITPHESMVSKKLHTPERIFIASPKYFVLLVLKRLSRY